jgi:uncharacterized membrane protein YgcG
MWVMKKMLPAIVLAGAFLLIPHASFAKSYHFESFSVFIDINEDTSVNVEERQVYSYSGSYEVGMASISLHGIATITNLEVIDGLTGKPLKYTRKRAPEGEEYKYRGQFAHWRDEGYYNVEWYYPEPITDRSHEWILRYTAHGAIRFLADSDELYWNIFTSISVPVNNVYVRVSLPSAEASQEDLRAHIYRGITNLSATAFVLSADKYVFETEFVEPYEPVTIAAEFPRGIVDRQAFWRWLILFFSPYILSTIIILLFVIYVIYYWSTTPTRGRGRGTIVPEYAPPNNLPPAMSDVILHKRLGYKTWPATIVDLAVRGHLIIKEESQSFIGIRLQPDYIIERTAIAGDNDRELRGYELKFMDALFSLDNVYSTKKMKRLSSSKRTKFDKKLEEVKKALYKETERDTDAFSVGITTEKYKKESGVSWLLFVSFLIFLISFIVTRLSFLIPLFVLMLSATFVHHFVLYYPRLSEKGALLREHILGFKMYMAVAEKYRMQNLTPEIFEKYLPYAIIFNLEKAWGRVFETQNLDAAKPNWYQGKTSFGKSGSVFSASQFSSSFSSSFSSAFSSGSGSAGGGGGRAGGGSGGGSRGAR